MDKNIPVYELLIDPSIGFEVNRISIVDDPAVESNFIAFSKDKEKTKQIFESQSDDYMELLGVAMTPDKLIPRKNDKTNERFNVWFSKETIRSIAQDFFYKGYQHSINLQHTDAIVDAHVYQSYIVDYDKGMYPPKGIEANDGTWIVGMKLNASSNGNRVWKAIKDEEIFKGFSIEGYFLDQLTKNFSIEKFQVNDALSDFANEMNAFINSLK